MQPRFLALLLIILWSCNEHEKADVANSTDFFEFENNYWVNLHHFLYQKAENGQLKKLNEDGLKFVEIGESAALKQLSDYEREVLDQAVQYYRDSLITKSLRRDLNDLRLWLAQQEEMKPIPNNAFGTNFTARINDASSVYAKYLWNIHKSHNLSVLEHHIATIDQIEEKVIHQMEGFSLNTWPDSLKVRVDITAYANWAGAYTSSKPVMNIVLSTTDPSKVTSAFVETILHEGSHLLYLFGESPIRDKFYDKSEALGIEFPRNLWHAHMFYLCGRAAQDEMSRLGMAHKMVMDVNAIFQNYNTTAFREFNEKYYAGQIDADVLVVELLKDVKNKSH